jgi:hypothetical protein
MNKNIIQGKFIIFYILAFITINFPSIILAQNSSPATDLSKVNDKKEIQYEHKLLWGERFYKLNLNSLALQQFEKAHKLKPGAYFPQYRINQLHVRLHQPKNTQIGDVVFDFNKPGILIAGLIIVILFSLVSMLVALITVLITRNKKIKQERYIQTLREKFQTWLVDYLFSKDIDQEVIGKLNSNTSAKLNRKILIDQMIDLSVTLTGIEKERLKDLYFKLKLDKDSYNKAFSRKWHIKAKGFRELAFMNIHTADEEILRCLSGANDILRMEAQFALIRLNTDNSFDFLNHLEKKFTLWEQLNVYETITFHQLSLPNFEQLLQSKNNSLVMFSLRMIRVFKLNNTSNALIKLLQTHPDEHIRNLIIQVLGNLKIYDSLPHLKKIYKNETYDNCMAILQAMCQMPDEEMLSFLKLVLDKEDDVQLQIEAAMAINKMGEKGSQTLTKLLNSDYKNYQIIIKHVLDKRIN